MSSPTLNLFADASGQAGYGAVLGQEWFYGAWDERWLGQNITLLELCPIVMAVKVWGPSLAHNCISFHTDNMALVEMINKQSSKESSTIALVRQLVLLCLQHNILFRAKHIPGKQNTCAQLNAVLGSLLAATLAPATQAAYSRSWALFRSFASEINISCDPPIALPALALFIAFLVDKQYAPSTVSSHVSAIGYVHKLRELPDPTSAFLTQKLLQACHKQRQRVDSRLPIDKTILEKLIAALPHTTTNSFETVLFKAMFALAFHAFLRVGEITVSNNNLPNPNLLQREQLVLGEKFLSLTFHVFKHSTGQPFTLKVDAGTRAADCPVTLMA
ncbi:hypothetical protein BaRGS_00033949 [Batillaria attramentaria]|uniref:RNase H type-1 domain-containing protein n=1 Tax=Batillaria attramentaria TaxID=370345 RepID=A0ABD0JJI4_9CAEN